MFGCIASHRVIYDLLRDELAQWAVSFRGTQREDLQRGTTLAHKHVEFMLEYIGSWILLRDYHVIFEEEVQVMLHKF